MIELVIMPRLLKYPDAVLWQYQQEMFEMLISSEKFSKEDAHALSVSLHDLVAQDPLDAQSAYSGLFGHDRAISLLLFKHAHGESHNRGQAMMDLMAQYERHGLLLDSHELSDHLPLYLEYLARPPEEEVLGGLRDVASIPNLLSARLQQRESHYAMLFELLLKLVNTQVDSQKVVEEIADEARNDIPQTLGAVQGEEQVKSFADQGCDESEISAHQRRFTGTIAPQYLNIPNGGQQQCTSWIYSSLTFICTLRIRRF